MLLSSVFLFLTLLATSAWGANFGTTYLPPPSSASSVSAETRSSDITKAKKFIPIVKSAFENEGDGTYSFSYDSENGIHAEEQGDARGDGTKAVGFYSFNLPNGEHVSIKYTADENGFVAEGSHIPTPHPIPEVILKALAENAAAEARGITDDGQYHGEGLEESQWKEEYNGNNNQILSNNDDGGYKY